MNDKTSTQQSSGIPGKDYPSIVQDKCTKCGICLKVCPTMAYEMRDDQVVIVRSEMCIKCGHCGATCPANAIIESFSVPEGIPASHLDSPSFPNALQLLFRSRRSVRRYKKQPLAREDLEKILEAGRYTATGTNAQTINYIVITDPEKIDELRTIALPVVMKMFAFIGKVVSMPFSSHLMGDEVRERMKNRYVPGMQLLYERQMQGEDRIFYDAPAIMLVTGEKYDETQAFSCAAALYNCSLMAHTLGIGCCFNGFLQTSVNFNKKLKKWMGIPKTQKCYGAMTLGYPNVKYTRLVKRNPARVRWI
ncbi:MAG: nitroreductase family protein [Deltaproteobacteria bacterium]|nr:MAG: nitroreductase family protein [Deltaproteobacteria bacterium]